MCVCGCVDVTMLASVEPLSNGHFGQVSSNGHSKEVSSLEVSNVYSNTAK